MKKLKTVRNEILIFFLFILLSIVATYPLILRMQSHIYGYKGDSLGALYGFWWYKYAHLNHISRWVISIVAFPFGADYSSSPRLLVIDSLGKWLSILVNEIFAYNFIILLTFLLSSIAMYLLVHYFTKNKLAGFFSGIIYAFSPYHFAHAFQHICLVNIQWMPLYILTLFKLDEERRYGWAILCGGFLALNTFSHYQYGYSMVVFTVVFVMWRAWQSIRGRKLSSYQVDKLTRKQVNKWTGFHSFKVVLVAVVVALAIILPFTHNIFKAVLVSSPGKPIDEGGFSRPLEDLFMYSAQFFHYLIPSGDNPLIGGFIRNFIKIYHPVEQTLYLGWVGIILSVVAIRQWRRKNREQRLQATGCKPQAIEQTSIQANWPTRTQKAVSFFLFAGIMALIFSHAPWTDIGPFRIFFPAYFMYKIAPMFRIYARFGILVMLSVSVLAGIGLAGLLQKIKFPKRQGILVAVITLLVFVEFAPTLPAPIVDAVNPPPVYEWLSQQEGDFVIVEYPLETDYEYLFWQRIHQKKLVNGARPGTYADQVRKKIVDILKPETPGILKYLGAKYVILHPAKYLESEDAPVIGEVPDISKQKGLKLVKAFDDARVYTITAEPIEPKID